MSVLLCQSLSASSIGTLDTSNALRMFRAIRSYPKTPKYKAADLKQLIDNGSIILALSQ